MIEATYSQAREQVTTLMDRAVVRRISVQRSSTRHTPCNTAI
ncbi:hypothetical protein [Lamprocystis purpurea]|jgi:hypothetical protein|nr:hypothetical protein [Lamprocystis purpurea]